MSTAANDKGELKMNPEINDGEITAVRLGDGCMYFKRGTIPQKVKFICCYSGRTSWSLPLSRNGNREDLRDRTHPLELPNVLLCDT